MLLFRQDLAFTADYGFYKPRDKTYCMRVKIHLRNELVRIAIFAWIFTHYWNGVNSNREGAWQVGFRRAKAKDLAGDHPQLSGDGRAGWKQNHFQVHGLKSKLCYNPK